MNFITIKEKIKNTLIWSQKYTKTDMVYLVKNSFWTSIGKIFSSLSGLLILIILTRFVSKDVVGQYNFYLSILAIIAVFSIPGLNTSSTEAIAKNYDGVYIKSVKTSFKWSWGGSLVFLLLSFYYFVNNDQSLFLAYLISAFLFPFLYAPNTWRYLLIGKQKFKVLNVLSSIQSLLYLITMTFVIIFGHGSLFFIISVYLIIQIITNLFNYYFCKKYIQNDNESEDWKSYGLFLTKIKILNLISANIDKIIIGIFLNMELLAVYSVAKKLVGSLQTLIKEFLDIYIPKIATRKKINFKKYFHICIWILFLGIVAIIFTPYIIKLFFPDYEISIIPTQIFLIFLPFWMLDLLLSYETSYNLKNKKIIFYKNIITPIIYFILIIPAVFYFKIIGLILVFNLKYITNIIIFGIIYLQLKSQTPNDL